MTKDRTFYNAFFRQTFAIALSSLITFSVSLADNIMLGGYSEAALSGVSLCNQYQFLLHQIILVGSAEGLAVLCAQYHGKKQRRPIMQITTAGILLGLGFAALLFALVSIFPYQSLAIFTKEQSFIRAGMEYFAIIRYTYPIFVLTYTLLASLRSVQIAHVGIFCSLGALITNVFLNYVLIYGNLGAPEMGVRGAAVATLVSRIIELVIVVGYILFRREKLGQGQPIRLGLNARLNKDYFKLTLPLLLSSALWGIATGAQTVILGRLGPMAITANSIAVTLFQFVAVTNGGSCNAAAVIIGKTVGEGRLDKVREYGNTLQILFLINGLLVGGLLFSLRNVILDFYVLDEATKALARSFITVLSVTVVGTAYQYPALGGIVRGAGDTTFVFKNDMIFVCLIVLPLSYLAAFVWNLSPVIVYACLKCDQILKCIVAAVKVNRYNFIKELAQDKDVVCDL